MARQIIVIIKHDFNSMENSCAEASEDKIVGFVDSEEKADEWIRLQNDKLYKGWDEVTYPYYTKKQIEDVGENLVITTFNYKVRIPTDAEYNRLMDITAEDNTVTHWKDMFSWVDDPKFVAEHPNFQAFRGCTFARSYDYASAGIRHARVGFRPAFEPLGNNALITNINDGDVVIVGTLYADGEPVMVPQNPVRDGDIKNYIIDDKLEFKPAINNPAYQVKAIKVGDVFICDRCLLKYISYENICDSFPNDN